MKTDEIIKALKICGTYGGKCTDCPAYINTNKSNCRKMLLGAVGIITKQKAEIKELKKKLKE